MKKFPHIWAALCFGLVVGSTASSVGEMPDLPLQPYSVFLPLNAALLLGGMFLLGYLAARNDHT